MRPILPPTYQSDACADKVENKRDVTKSKTVTKGGLQKLPNTFQPGPFRQKSACPGIFTGCWRAWPGGAPASPSGTRSGNP